MTANIRQGNLVENLLPALALSFFLVAAAGSLNPPSRRGRPSTISKAWSSAGPHQEEIPRQNGAPELYSGETTPGRAPLWNLGAMDPLHPLLVLAFFPNGPLSFRVVMRSLDAKRELQFSHHNHKRRILKEGSLAWSRQLSLPDRFDGFVAASLCGRAIAS